MRRCVRVECPSPIWKPEAMLKTFESTGTPVIDMITLKIRVRKNIELLSCFHTTFLNDMKNNFGTSMNQTNDPA